MRKLMAWVFMYSLDGLLADPADLEQKIGVYRSAYAHLMDPQLRRGRAPGERTLTGVAWQTKSARVVPRAVTTTLIVASQLSGAGPPGPPDSPPITVYEPAGSVTEYRPSAPTRATWPCPLPFGAKKPSIPPRRCTVPLPGRKFSPPR